MLLCIRRLDCKHVLSAHLLLLQLPAQSASCICTYIHEECSDPPHTAFSVDTSHSSSMLNVHTTLNPFQILQHHSMYIYISYVHTIVFAIMHNYGSSLIEILEWAIMPSSPAPRAAMLCYICMHCSSVTPASEVLTCFTVLMHLSKVRC